jgi:hypothetical protein
MPIDDIANPLLRSPEMRTTGRPLVAHAGQSPQLGAGQQIGWSILSPIEFVFRETTNGQGARGGKPLNKFYRVRQNVTSTKIWSFLDDQGWQDPVITGLENDDPVDTAALALSFQTQPDPLISFYDSPGFTMPPQNTMGVNQRAIKVFLLQCFQVWCEVSPSFGKGTFQASPAKSWNNLICVKRDSADAVQWTVASSALVSGRAIVDRPLCD